MLQNQTIPTPVLIEDLGMQYPSETAKRKYRFGNFKCHCGTEFKAMFGHIKSGSTMSCGCYSKQRSREQLSTHGFTKHPLHRVWLDMKSRCFNVKNSAYSNYGGRGITVCDRWMDINNFIEDMNPTYQQGLTIDRIDSNGNYEPSNCRWATDFIQARNTRVIMATNTSGYRGVSKHKDKWQCKIKNDGKTIYLGVYATALEAAIAYDCYVIQNNLEHTINGVVK